LKVWYKEFENDVKLRIDIYSKRPLSEAILEAEIERMATPG
jgi:hypothetical protein